MTSMLIRLLTVLCLLAAPISSARAQTLDEQNEALLQQFQQVHQPTPDEMQALRVILNGSPYIGQGNPAITRHPATPEACTAKLVELGVSYEHLRDEAICDDKYMAPLYDPLTETPQQSRACIDRFEFPNIPCAYPVVWVRAREAAQMCEAVGKRLCDAHEWEGACAGSLEPPDYSFELAEDIPPQTGFNQMRRAHNRVYDNQKTWAYGSEYETGICAATSQKSPGCDGGGWSGCGSNTFPTGMYPECRSTLGVYDLHGNAAEHMNLPLAADQMTSQGSTTLGYTEMKGSWFIFDSFKAHEDACRWRAPYWHGSRVMDTDSHHNYHLGFRCCKTIGPE